MKSASISCRKADFIAKRFHPPKVDFFRRRRISLKKALARASAFFWCGRQDLNSEDSLALAIAAKSRLSVVGVYVVDFAAGSA